MLVKPFQSKLAPHEEEIRSLLLSGESYRRIATKVNNQYNLSISHNAVFSFTKSRLKKQSNRKPFYDDLPNDIREALLKQVAAIWIYDSTAIEGNSLTLACQFSSLARRLPTPCYPCC